MLMKVLKCLIVMEYNACFFDYDVLEFINCLKGITKKGKCEFLVCRQDELSKTVVKLLGGKISIVKDDFGEFIDVNKITNFAFLNKIDYLVGVGLSSNKQMTLKLICFNKNFKIFNICNNLWKTLII